MVEMFQKTGNQATFTKKLNTFVLKQNGYIVPVQLTVKYFNSHTYGHTYTAFFLPFKDLIFQDSSVPHPINKVLLLLTDSEEGRIFDVNKVCLTVLGLNK